MKFYIADAFTDKVFGGNPAGVVILDEGMDFPEAETMRLTAAELRYSETAFIKQLDEGVFNVRYFTPADEVDLCGHATIASFHCLREAGLVKPGQVVQNKTLAGDLNIVIAPDSILMDMATPEYIGEISDPEAVKELYEIMGLSPDAAGGLKTDIISTGLPDILMPVATREQLAAISPDFPALTELSRKYNVFGVHAYTLDGGKHRGGSDVDAYCRNFAPLYDIDEEAATGTSNGALTYGLLRNGTVQMSH
ncbi:MAG: PhzF family phenazine biosynthesis protein, partial [Firmicutes bacterium]|nr:PhzF family phenazine biosynthesis protein [Bacillota bacterium]